MFSSIEKMIQEARIARGDIEKQYTLYYRCAQLSKLICKQNDFKKFKSEVSANHSSTHYFLKNFS